jgi:hypothetical protein
VSAEVRAPRLLHDIVSDRNVVAIEQRKTPREPNTGSSGNWRVPCDDTYMTPPQKALYRYG